MTGPLWPHDHWWWRHQMETFSALLAHSEGNPLVTGGFPSQRLMTRNFDVYIDLRPNKRLRKQSRRRWFETPSRSLWRHCNEWCGKWFHVLTSSWLFSDWTRDYNWSLSIRRMLHNPSYCNLSCRLRIGNHTPFEGNLNGLPLGWKILDRWDFRRNYQRNGSMIVMLTNSSSLVSYHKIHQYLNNQPEFPGGKVK